MNASTVFCSKQKLFRSEGKDYRLEKAKRTSKGTKAPTGFHAEEI